jgi:hypothetical protein
MGWTGAHMGDDGMTRAFRTLVALAGYAALALGPAACAPTVHVKVDPITIYAKLDANVRLQLDQDVKDLIKKNPDLF